MKYEFYEGNEIGTFGYAIIDFKILDNKYEKFNLDHLGSLSGDYIREIVEKIELVKDGKLDVYGFGPHNSVYVEIAGPTFHRKEFRNKAYITKALSDDEITIDSIEIYNLMKNFLTEIDKWEKETGKEKPGW